MSAVSSKTETREASDWGVAAGFACAMAALFGPQIILGEFLPYTVGLLPVTLNVKFSLARIIFDGLGIVVIAWIIRRYGHTLSKIGLRQFRVGYIGKALLGFVAYYIIVRLLLVLVALIAPIDEHQAQELGYQSLNTLELILAFLTLVVITPLAEEMIFRGFLFTGLRRRLPFWAATLLVSVLFGWVHGQWNVGLDVFALSLVLCSLREYTTSLWPSILLHAFKNGLAFYLLYLYTGA